jgi:hypothetical protein
MWRLLTTIGCLLAVLWLSHMTEAASTATRKQPPKQQPPAPTTRLNVDILPPLQNVLDELEFSSYLKNFVRMGVTETRLLLRLSAMDFQIMTMDWPEFSTDDVAKLKEKIKQLTALATVTIEPIREDLIARNKIIYGRIFMPLGVQSIEFNVASFGGPPPMGDVPLQFAETLYECPPESTDNSSSIPPQSNIYENRLVVVVRGNCTFLQKAMLIKARGGRGMLVVNTEDKLESLASGVGINKTVTEEQTRSLGSFFIVAVSNNSYLTLHKAVQFAAPVHPFVQLVPLKCTIGSSCAPLTPEEKQLQSEVSWGKLSIFSETDSNKKKTFEFMTSNYGAPLPPSNQQFHLDTKLLTGDDWTIAQRQLCSPISSMETVAFSLDSNTSFLEIPLVSLKVSTSAEGLREYVLIAERGGCSFDTKSFYAQQAGYRLLILTNTQMHHPLQRIGGINPSIGRVGIPTLLLLPEFTTYLRTNSAESWLIEIESAKDDSVFERWVEVTYSSARWTSAPSMAALISPTYFLSLTDIESQEMIFQRMLQKMQKHDTLVEWIEHQLITSSQLKQQRQMAVKDDL